VGRRLGVKHVLEGSVRKAGDRFRITAQLIDVQTGGHVWAERFDRDLSDIFAVQDEATRKIVEALRVRLTDPERCRLEHHRKVDFRAYDLVVQARRHLHQYSAEAILQARALLEQASRIDPGYAQAFAIMALARTMEFANGWNDSSAQDLVHAIELANKAMVIDPDTALAYHALALAHLWRRDYGPAESAARRCIALGPNYSEGFRALGQVLDFTGRQAEAIGAFERAMRLNPEQDLNLHLLGRAYLGLDRLDEAEKCFRRRLVYSPDSDMTRAYLASIYGSTGRFDLAKETWRGISVINPNFSIERLRDNLPYRDPAWFDRIAYGLHRAGIALRDPAGEDDNGISQ
jgi:adenylate cyclase